LEVGLAGKILEFPKCVYSYITPTWLTQTWESCREAFIQILSDSMDFSQPREKDMELMQIFIRSGYRHTELGMLNRCCLFSQMTYLSNICNATGTKLEQYLWQTPHRRESTYIWLAMLKPTQMDWRLWQQALQDSLLLGRNLTLPTPLGKWHTTMGNRPGWYYHPVENALYHRMETEITRHSMYPRQSRLQAFHAVGEMVPNTEPSHEWQKASVTIQEVKVILTAIGASHNPTLTMPIPWYTQMEQTILGTGWQLRLNI